MANERFTKQQRLLKPADFKRVFDCASRSRDRYFTVLKGSPSATCRRLGLAISKKTDRRAVVRNRIKRVIRESFRRLPSDGADYVVISKPAAAQADRQSLSDSLNRHWQKLTKTENSRDINH